MACVPDRMGFKILTRRFLAREESSMTDLLALVQLAGDNILQVEAGIRHEMMGKS